MIGRSVAASPEHVWESERRVLRAALSITAANQPRHAGNDTDDKGRDHHAHPAPRRSGLEPEPAARPGSASAASIRSRRTISCAM